MNPKKYAILGKYIEEYDHPQLVEFLKMMIDRNEQANKERHELEMSKTQLMEDMIKLKFTK